MSDGHTPIALRLLYTYYRTLAEMKTVEVRLCEHALSSAQGEAPKGVDMILSVQFAKWAERSSASALAALHFSPSHRLHKGDG